MPKDNNNVEYKYYPFQVKGVDVDSSEFTGFSAAMGNEDLSGDIITPGAFKKTISERVEAGNVKLLDNHDGESTRNVWGTIVEASEVPVDVSGDNAPTHKLFTRFKVSEADPDAQVALRKIDEGHLNQLSIGFKPIKTEFEIDEDSDFDDPRTAWVFGEGIRRIKELKLFEVSLVIWAMNPEATIIGNSLKSLTQFAQKVNQKGIDVPETAVKEAVLALNSLLGQSAESKEMKKAIARALDDVSDAVDEVCSVAQKGRMDPVKDLLEEFKEDREEWTKNEFGLWVAEQIEEAVDDEVEEAEEKTCDCQKEEESEEEEKSSDDSSEDEKETEEEVEEKEDSVDETEEKDEPATASNEEVVAAIGELSETINSLKSALVGAEETDSDDSKDQDADTEEKEEAPESHTEDTDEEAAKDTDEDSHSKHFPDENELAAELERLELFELEAELDT